MTKTQFLSLTSHIPWLKSSANKERSVNTEYFHHHRDGATGPKPRLCLEIGFILSPCSDWRGGAAPRSILPDPPASCMQDTDGGIPEKPHKQMSCQRRKGQIGAGQTWLGGAEHCQYLSRPGSGPPGMQVSRELNCWEMPKSLTC